MMEYEGDATQSQYVDYCSNDFQLVNQRFNEINKFSLPLMIDMKQEIKNVRKIAENARSDNERKEKLLNTLKVHLDQEQKELDEKRAELNKILEEVKSKPEAISSNAKSLECLESFNASSREMEKQKFLLELYQEIDFA